MDEREDGFYKLSNNELLFGRRIFGPGFNLDADISTEGFDGWIFFQTKSDAEKALY